MPVVPRAALELVARRFALLGDTTRLRILSVVHDRGVATVGEIAEAAEVSVANASQHLGRLAVGGIVARQRQGRSVVYSICDPSIEQLCSIVCASLLDGADATRAAVGHNALSPTPSSSVGIPAAG
jgi:DNA-binding transcriptional ArsR family regulator